jgi:transposase
MKPIIDIDIKESKAELEELYKNSSSFLQPRIQMFIMLLKEPGLSKSQLARRLNVVYNSISKWHELYSAGGIEKLLEVRRGKYRLGNGSAMGFSANVYEAIEKRHAVEPFQSYVELHQWIKDNYLPVIKYSTLIKYIDIHYGGSFKVTRILELPVKESTTDLQAMHARCLPRMKPRIEMLIALKQNEKISRVNLANKLKVSYGSVIKWSNIYKQGGIGKLLEYKLTLIITPEVYAYIENRFKQNKFSNFSELYRKISKDYLPDIKYYTLHRYVHRHFRGEINTAKALSMPIKETMQELKDLSNKNSGDKKRRMKMLMSLKEDPALTKMELGDICGVAVGSIHRWCKLYKQGGLNRMLEIKMRGRKRLELPDEVDSLLAKKIKREPDTSVKDLHEWLTSFYREPMSYNKLYRYIRRNFDNPVSVNYNHKINEQRTFSRVA